MNPPAGDGFVAQIAPEIVQQAIHWMIRLEGVPVDPRQEERCAQWRRAHPDHELAWRRLQLLNQRVASLSMAVPPAFARETLERPQQLHRHGRRNLLVALITSASVGAWVFRRPLGIPSMLADYRTGKGERRRITLPDGTRLDINANSAVDVAFDTVRRLLVLHQGDVVISTGDDLGQVAFRPFTVRTGHGELVALGTRYMVRRRADATHVAVYEGAVRVFPQDSEGGGTLVPAGSQTRFDAARVAALELARSDEDAWTDGLLIARQMRLADFVAELSQYRAGWITCDPSVADLRVSGVYPLDDTMRALSALPDTLPVKLSMRTRYWVTVIPR